MCKIRLRNNETLSELELRESDVSPYGNIRMFEQVFVTGVTATTGNISSIKYAIHVILPVKLDLPVMPINTIMKFHSYRIKTLQVIVCTSNF